MLPSPKELRTTLKESYEGHFSYELLLLVLILALAGSAMIFSASYAYAEVRYGTPYYFIFRQSIWLFVGIGVMLALSSIPIHAIRLLSPSLYGITLLLLIAVLVIGSTGNGAQRWISLGPITLQPSEIAKTTLVLILAYYYDKNAERCFTVRGRNSFVFGTLLPFLLIGAICLLVMLQKHLSGLIIIGCIGVSVMFLSGIRLRYLGILGALASLGVTALALFTDYTKRRITIWQNPELYPLDGGWQTLQGLMAIGSGGFWGRGFGKSWLKHSYVSEPANDMIFTILCEELGFIGAFATLFLFVLFIWRVFRLSLFTSGTFERLVTLGIGCKVGIQVLLNVAVVTNTIPNTGISLPFFSYGGSSLLMLFAEMGILLSISRSAKIND